MGAGGDFGDDATVSLVNVDLRDDDIRKNPSAVFNNSGSGFVAAGFDAEDFHRV